MLIPMMDMLDPDFANILDKMDTNHDGVLSAHEINTAPQSLINKLRDHADTQSEWNVIRDISTTRGEYMDSQGIIKSIDPGRGGRFRMLVDELKSIQGMDHTKATAIAAKVANQKRAEWSGK